MRKKICMICLLAFLIGFSGKSFAGEIYTAVTKGYYAHPNTGQVEDPGNNPGIGEGMISNVVGAYSLIEKDDDGRLYATVRFGLRDQVKDIKIWVQNEGSSSFIPVNVEETKNQGDSGDFRFEIPSTNCIVKASFFVEPMGRDVIFFLDFSSLEEGNTDFKVFVNTEKENEEQQKPEQEQETTVEKKEEPKKEEPKKEEQKKAEPKKAEPKTVNRVVNPNFKKEPIQMPSKDEKISQGDLGYEHGVLTNQDFDDQKTLLDPSSKDQKRPWGIVTKVLFTIVVVLISIMISIFLLGAIAIAIYYKYKKNQNSEMEKLLEDRDV